MTKITDFKNIADNIMNDITVSDRLKEKTLDRCMKRNKILNIPFDKIGKFLVPVACCALIIGFVKISGILPLKTQIGDERFPEINIAMDAGRTTEISPGVTKNVEPYNNAIWDNGTRAIEIRDIQKLDDLSSLDEAAQVFGDEILSPSYIPEGFELKKIQALASDSQKSSKIILSYFTEEQSFSVIQEKTEDQNDPTGYKIIDLDGITGYLRTIEEHYDEEVRTNKQVSDPENANRSYSDETNISKAFTGESNASGGGETGNDASFSNDANVENDVDINNDVSDNEISVSNAIVIDSAQKLHTELFWFSNGVNYSVIGQITESEAVKVAKSMK